MVSRGANHRPTSYDMMEPNDQYPNNDSAIDMRGHQVLPPLCGNAPAHAPTGAMNYPQHQNDIHYGSTYSIQHQPFHSATHPPASAYSQFHRHNSPEYSPHGTAAHGYSEYTLDAMNARQHAYPGYVPPHRPELLLQAARFIQTNSGSIRQRQQPDNQYSRQYQQYQNQQQYTGPEAASVGGNLLGGTDPDDEQQQESPHPRQQYQATPEIDYLMDHPHEANPGLARLSLPPHPQGLVKPDSRNLRDEQDTNAEIEKLKQTNESMKQHIVLITKRHNIEKLQARQHTSDLNTQLREAQARESTDAQNRITFAKGPSSKHTKPAATPSAAAEQTAADQDGGGRDGQGGDDDGDSGPAGSAAPFGVLAAENIAAPAPAAPAPAPAPWPADSEAPLAPPPPWYPAQPGRPGKRLSQAERDRLVRPTDGPAGPGRILELNPGIEWRSRDPETGQAFNGMYLFWKQSRAAPAEPPAEPPAPAPTPAQLPELVPTPSASPEPAAAPTPVLPANLAAAAATKIALDKEKAAAEKVTFPSPSPSPVHVLTAVLTYSGEYLLTYVLTYSRTYLPGGCQS